MALDLLDTTPAVSPRAAPAPAPATRQRRGWLRRSYSPVEEAEHEQGTAPPRWRCTDAIEDGEEDKKGGKETSKKAARRRGWLRRLVSREYALGRRWKLISGATSRRLRWKRVSSSLSAVGLGGGGGCASAMIDTVAFRVMYVVEAVVLGLALSCFFCCCGCQI